MKFQTQLLFIILICFIGGCDQEKIDTQQINPTDVKYFCYKPGTYWIYRDSLTGEIDSFAVTSVYSSAGSVGSTNIAFENDEINIFYNGIQDTLVANWQLSGNNIVFYYGIYYYLNSIEIGFSFPFTQYDTVYSTFTIGNNSFNNVAQFKVIDTVLNSTDIFYVNSAVGMVKMNLNNPTNPIHRIWEVQRFKIVH